MDSVPICKAKSKQSGQQCRNFATKGKEVCRIHGGKSSGAKTREGVVRLKKANWKHGLYSKEAIEERKSFKAMLAQHKDLIHDCV